MNDSFSLGGHGAAKHYRSIAGATAIEGASPHRLVALLIDGALERLYRARGAMANGLAEEKGALIGNVLAIVEGLRASLDMEKGGEIAANLDRLYDYILRTVLEANLANSDEKLLEVVGLLQEIKSGWDAIPSEFHHTS